MDLFKAWISSAANYEQFILFLPVMIGEKGRGGLIQFNGEITVLATRPHLVGLNDFGPGSPSWDLFLWPLQLATSYMVGPTGRVLMAETAIQFLERWRQAHVYAELRALEQLDETVAECIGALFGVLSLRLFGWCFLSLGAAVPTNPARRIIA